VQSKAESAHRYYETHKDQWAEYARRYREANREKLAEAARARYHSDPKKARERVRVWSMANPERAAERVKLGRKTRIQTARDLLNGKCVRCGSTEDLHFHHIDPTTKVAKVTRLAYSRGLGAVLDEAAKCELLCGPCHRSLHKPKRAAV
jgi:5-methylcytosine-specific restriction endonuclease McrA